MITALQIRNFKSWEDTGQMRLAPLTGLFGANSSGKSGILQFLLMLKQTVESTNQSEPLDLGGQPSDYVDLGDFATVLHAASGASPTGRLEWAFEWLDRSVRRGGVASTVYRAGIADRRQRPGARQELEYLSYQLADGRAGERLGLRIVRSADANGGFEVESLGDAARFSAGPEPAPTIAKCYAFSGVTAALTDLAWEYVARLILNAPRRFESEINAIHYVGPLRALQPRIRSWNGVKPANVGSAGAETLDALVAARRRLDSDDRDDDAEPVEEAVALWLRKLGLVHSFRLEELGNGSGVFRAMVRQTSKSPELALTDIGLGASQVLPVVVQCFYVPRGSTLLFEQPDIHLHPGSQSKLADLFIEVVRRRNLQLLIESHSEHLLVRLQRRIAERKLDSDDAALYFCHTKQGASKATPLRLDQFGYIANWPDDFFGDEFEERAKMMEATIRRKQEIGVK